MLLATVTINSAATALISRNLGLFPSQFSNPSFSLFEHSIPSFYPSFCLFGENHQMPHHLQSFILLLLQSLTSDLIFPFCFSGEFISVLWLFFVIFCHLILLLQPEYSNGPATLPLLIPLSPPFSSALWLYFCHWRHRNFISQGKLWENLQG